MTRVTKFFVVIFLFCLVVIFNFATICTCAQSAKETILDSAVVEEKDIYYRETPIGLILSLSNNLVFSVNKYGQKIINPYAYEILDKIFEIISAIPNKCVIEGHTSDDGAEFESSILNAEVLANYFISKNKSLHGRIFSIGLGDSEPYSTEDKSYIGNAMDNRIDIIIIEYKTKR